ncbi:MAG: hypothetical protein M1828_002275 [Chrysothrix sp. TS-e1954]|nr:MAG: hypothetical protein M1828_002275 [Chrysothrix sp. TS-e1954]
MPLTVLTDADVCAVLDTLTADDVNEMHMKLADALHTYSTATDSEDQGCCASNQPKRIMVKRKDGPTTLFMPAMSDDALGVKIATLDEKCKFSRSKGSLPINTKYDTPPGSPRSSSPAPRASLAEGTRTSSPMLSKANSFARPSSPTSSTPRSSSPSAGVRKSSTVTSQTSSGSSRKDSSISSRKDSTISTRSTSTTATATSSSGSTSYTVPDVVPPGTPLSTLPTIPRSGTSPTGSLTLLSQTGQPRALLNCSTLTAFRTALASTFLFRKRASVHTITVFGAGLQAYWHVHLAILLRGTEIHRIHLINRDFARAQQLFIKLAQQPNEAIDQHFVSGKLRPSILTPEYNEYDRLLKEHVRGADVIFCTTPSSTPLFPAGHLTNTEGRRKARYIAAIGSYKPHMQELHEDILRQAVRGPGSDSGSDSGSKHAHHGLHIHHRHASDGGAVVVDSIEGAMRESGEVIRSGIGGQGIVELGELVMLKRNHWAEKAEREERERRKREKEGHKTHDKGGHGIGHLFHGVQSHLPGHHEKAEGGREKAAVSKEGDGGLQEWLARGNVIYKSVGIGLMDVVVGMEIVRLAEERGIGTFVEDF